MKFDVGGKAAFELLREAFALPESCTEATIHFGIDCVTTITVKYHADALKIESAEAIKERFLLASESRDCVLGPSVESMALQPIETAPKDGTDILVFVEVATVRIAHIAWWRNQDDNPDFTADDVGWWSYTRGSVRLGLRQEKLDGHRTPTHWMPLPDFPD